MKRKIINLLFTLFAVTSLISCSPNSSGSEFLGDEEWHGNWEGSEDIEDDPQIEIVCKQKCPVCGKCLDPDCTIDTEKCYDLNGRTKYEFLGSDKRVKVTAGSKGPLNQVANGGYIDNFNNNEGAEIEYTIIASEATTACMGATISMMPLAMSLTTTCETYVNGEKLLSNSQVKANLNWPYIPGTTTIPSPNEWYNFTEYFIGCVNLKEGENTIRIVNPNRGAYQFNFKSIEFLSSVPLELGNASGYVEHVCENHNADGLCTNYDCNELVCLNKDETDWTHEKLTLDAGEDYVLKFDDNNDNIYNSTPGEECIGYIDSYNSNQTIIWSFNATEETYVRLSLEHSGGLGHGSPYIDTWNLFFNDEQFTTGALAKCNDDANKWNYGLYGHSTIAYVKAKPGKNTFKMIHNSTTGYNIRSLDIYNQKGELSPAQAEK